MVTPSPEIEAAVGRDLDGLGDRDPAATLGTVLMSDDAAAVAFMDRKHERCESLGIETERVDLSPAAPATAPKEARTRLAGDDPVTATFVQVPLPDHVDEGEVRNRSLVGKDVDCFANANLGRLVAGEPRIHQ